MIPPQKMAAGWFLFTPETSQQQVHEFADSLTGPVPAELQGATMSVSTR